MKHQAMSIVLIAALAIGLMAGCMSNMVALQSKMSTEGKVRLNGEYVLESVKVVAPGLDADLVSKAVESATKSIFTGDIGSKRCLPVKIIIERNDADANGGVSKINNLLSLCTLTIWPCVTSEESTYTIKVHSVVGSHEMSYKVISRSWFGLSPAAMIPVPGWADERGDADEILKFHIAKIENGAREVCAQLSADYEAFLRDQPKYLEKIDRERSEAAYVLFAMTKNVAALDGLTNTTVMRAHQKDLVAAFKNAGNNSVAKSAILKKLTDESVRELPYDPSLVPYWKKINDQRLLAKIYRDGGRVLLPEELDAIVNRIDDSAVLLAMVTPTEGGLYISDVRAQACIYGKLDPSVVHDLALRVLAKSTANQWNNDSNVELEAVVQMAKCVSDRTTGGRIAIALIRRAKGLPNVAKFTEAVEGLLTDDLLEEVVKEDETELPALAHLFKDKKRPSFIGFSRIQSAIRGGKENDIAKAWKAYGRAISDDEMLKTLSLASVYLRRPAFDQISDQTVKANTLAAIKDELKNELKACADKQGKLANFIAEIGNGNDLVEWIKGRKGQTSLQSSEAFAKMKGRTVVLRGEVRNIGQTAFSGKTYVSLCAAKISAFNSADVQFNVPDSLKPTVLTWMKGENRIMRGRLTSRGDLEDDAECDNGEIVSEERFNEAVSLRAAMEDIKWQLREIDAKNVPPVRTRKSQFGNAVKSAAGAIKDAVEDIKFSGEDLQEAAEIIQGLLN